MRRRLSPERAECASLPPSAFRWRGLFASVLRGWAWGAKSDGELVGTRKLFEVPESELLEKGRRRPVHQRTSHSFTASDDVDQSALVQRFQNRAGVDAADLFDFRAPDRLPV